VNSATICSGETTTLTASPTQTGGTYAWSNTATTASITVSLAAATTYTVTYSLGGCASATGTGTVTVNPLTTPTFTQVSAICSGALLNSLSTTSNNSIVGTWTPVLNNTATTTYTFTPSSAASPTCATTTTMTVIVNPLTTPTFTQVSPICSGAALNALPTTSDNSIVGTWSPSVNNTATTTYTFTPSSAASPTCATITTTTITVNPLPVVTLATFNQFCDTLGLVTLSGGAPSGGVYSGSSVSNNSFNTAIGSGIYPITYNFSDNNGCSSNATQNLTIIDCSGVGLEDLTENEVSIYPNPTDNIFTIEVSDFIIGQTFAVYDIRGRLLLNGKLNETKTSINVSSFATGTYYVNLPESNKMMKLIKQ
jgi:hypothetical protein